MGIRSKVRGSDFAATAHAGYLKGGFAVVATRQPGRTHSMPEWMGVNAEVKEFIRKMFPLAGRFGNVCQCDPCSFPKYKMDRRFCRCRWCMDTMQAARWLTVIYRWFRMGQPDAKIEMDSRWKPGTVGSIVQKIRRIIAGQRQDGLPRTGKPRGRPKKITALDPIIPDNQRMPLSEACEIESTVFANSC
jgi:hypothetical protein